LRNGDKRRGALILIDWNDQAFAFAQDCMRLSYYMEDTIILLCRRGVNVFLVYCGLPQNQEASLDARDFLLFLHRLIFLHFFFNFFLFVAWLRVSTHLRRLLSVWMKYIWLSGGGLL
jgi:hypothetical protein